jgi:hypothetical protein
LHARADHRMLLLLRFVESIPDHGPQVSCPVCLQVLKSHGT